MWGNIAHKSTLEETDIGENTCYGGNVEIKFHVEKRIHIYSTYELVIHTNGLDDRCALSKIDKQRHAYKS